MSPESVFEARALRVMRLSALVGLRKVKALLGTERSWCTDTLATARSPVSHRRATVGWWDELATRWCLTGAVFRVAKEMTDHPGSALRAIELSNLMTIYLRDAGQAIWGKFASPVHVNDSLGFDAVHITLDAAIKTAKQRVASLPA